MSIIKAFNIKSRTDRIIAGLLLLLAFGFFMVARPGDRKTGNSNRPVLIKGPGE